MANKSGFGEVESSAEELQEIDEKIKAHRHKNIRRVVIALIILAVLLAFGQMWMELRTYSRYEITSSVEQGDKSAAHFVPYGDNIIEYSNDGAKYIDAQGNQTWNCAFEMTNPDIDISGDYVAFFDKEGTFVYIMNKSGVVSQIEAPLPIRTACVADQGTVAVLLENGMNYTLKMYDKSGKELAGGEFYGDQGSIPVDIALSYDGKKLAVDMVDITGGTVKSMITFYNFGDVGQNEINNNVGSYTYEDTFIPQIEYVSDSVMFAAGDDALRIFTGSQKPVLSEEIKYDHEINTFFYSEDNAGVVYNNNDEEGTHHLVVYNTRGKVIMEKDFSIDYDTVEFLSNGEVCIRNKFECEIYTLHSIKKFAYTFDKELYKIIYDGGVNNYVFILEDATEEVRLK